MSHNAFRGHSHYGYGYGYRRYYSPFSWIIGLIFIFIFLGDISPIIPIVIVLIIVYSYSNRNKNRKRIYNQPVQRRTQQPVRTTTVPQQSYSAPAASPKPTYVQRPQPRYCNACGSSIMAQASFCDECGTKA